jgi:hypothetical protein
MLYIYRGVGSIKKLGAPVSRGNFGMKRASKNVSRKCRQRGSGGGGEGKINAIILKSKFVEADSLMRSNESDRMN